MNKPSVYVETTVVGHIDLGDAAIDYTFSEPTNNDIDDQFWDDLKNDRIPIQIQMNE